MDSKETYNELQQRRSELKRAKLAEYRKGNLALMGQLHDEIKMLNKALRQIHNAKYY